MFCIHAVPTPDVPLFLTVSLLSVSELSQTDTEGLISASRASSIPGVELVLEYGHADFLKLYAEARLALFAEINDCVFSPCSKFSYLLLHSLMVK